MFASRRHAAAVIATAVLIAAPACVSGGSYQYPDPAPTRPIDDRAYRIGYQEGRDHGEKDRRSERRFDYARHGDYRDADDGYRYGNRYAYQLEFRRGFVDGYNAGYRYIGNVYPPTRPGRSVDDNRGQYPGHGNTPAWQHGYRDGYDQGRKDVRDGDRFDPVRSSRYRSGDHDYDRRNGSRDEYKREYRSAFQRGYTQGYREYRR